MLLIGLCAVLAVVAAAERPVVNKASGWSQFEAGRRYALQKPKQVTYDPLELDRFLFAIMDKLEDMPMPDDPKYEFVRDEHKQLHACEIPEDDDEAMEFSANPDAVMETVLRSFPDGKCAGRIFGEWYYEVCGNMEVKRAAFTVAYSRGKPKVTTFKAYESLGVLGRDRKVSRHLDSITEPRYVQQTYYDGAKCNLGGQPRRMQSVVTFECSHRFVAGYVHIAEVVEVHPCKYRLVVQSTDFCANDWLYGMVEENSVVRCRMFLHPERIRPLMSFLDKYHEETKEKLRRYAKYMDEPAMAASVRDQMSRPDARARIEEFAKANVRQFDRRDAEYGIQAERERNKRILDYVMSELTWASLNPDVPYTEEELRARREEETAGREDDERRLVTVENVLNYRRSDLMDEVEDDEEKEYYDIMGFTELLEIAEDIAGLRRDPYLNFYTAWLDYIRMLEVEEHVVVRPWLIPPNRKPFALGAFVLLEALIKSDQADEVRRLFEGLKEEEKPKEPVILYDGELDEDDLEEIARKFMQVYRAAKAGGSDTLLFELLDDEDFEY
ncbi:hypothetical protein PRIPAC_94931 [Pristionchus pacificus]|uniref:Endoplasmic reticulum lectin 1 n=1 Tax=Pristionchus pacificus TaxID=54126 RepID=A0A2A6CI61_PRIPA|nr:hypothetical protein PRIPAC_94931 [Pristionchus pacificus]|eukprot:PDM77829.1 hypothetical protein PRIPAC_34696 [Pristionchus pacificus]